LEKTPLVVDIQGNLMNQHQIQDFSSDCANSNFEMVYNIMMVFCMFMMALLDFKFSKPNMML
jgi:hypothetical protein